MKRHGGNTFATVRCCHVTTLLVARRFPQPPPVGRDLQIGRFRNFIGRLSVDWVRFDHGSSRELSPSANVRRLPFCQFGRRMAVRVYAVAIKSRHFAGIDVGIRDCVPKLLQL